jgi:hypothetical protein
VAVEIQKSETWIIRGYICNTLMGILSLEVAVIHEGLLAGSNVQELRLILVALRGRVGGQVTGKVPS